MFKNNAKIIIVIKTISKNATMKSNKSFQEKIANSLSLS
jgi:hypothetical protein